MLGTNEPVSVDDVNLQARYPANQSPSNGHVGVSTPSPPANEVRAGLHVTPKPTPPPTRPMHTSPAINHIDFWPTCITPALKACDATFEPFK